MPKTNLYCLFVRENATAAIVDHEILEMDETVPAEEAVQRVRLREIALAEKYPPDRHEIWSEGFSSRETLDRVRPELATRPLDPRAIEFLRESNAIEDITDIDYRDAAHRHRDRGHFGALVRMLERAAQFPLFDMDAAAAWFANMQKTQVRPLTIEEICAWQGMLAAEQVEAGHTLPAQAIGRIRSPELPVNVFVGTHVAPTFMEVPGRLDKWIESLNQSLARLRPAQTSDVEGAECLGTHFQWFEAIHPFVDGNGRVGRLIANYIASFVQQPLIIFRASERPSYYAAHRSKAAMRVFMADKIRERMRGPRGEILERTQTFSSGDQYPGFLAERHDLLRARAEWQRAADAK